MLLTDNSVESNLLRLSKKTSIQTAANAVLHKVKRIRVTP